MHTTPLFGTAYYPEYTPNRSVHTDLDLMLAAGMTLVRVGESVWSTWEPDDGLFDLDWLQETLDGCHERGISVIIGTPTYAVPPWLARAHPEIAARDADGRPVPWGGRQEMDFTHPTYLRYAERVIRKVIGRYATHPAVIGYQVDNEPGNRLLHNDGVFERFVAELRSEFGSVAKLNEAWGLTHWSHRLTRWGDLWRPGGNLHPQYDLAWRRFQARLTTEFITWQADLVREIAEGAGRSDQFVTTCVATDVAAIDELTVNERLDVTAGNPYFPMQDDLALPAPDVLPDRAWMVSGAWQVSHLGDRMWAFNQRPFLVTETNAGATGDSTVNRPGWDGQWRQGAWAFIARGARAFEYWHWNSLHTGTEMPYAGVLPHDQRPGRFYREVARIGADLQAAGEHIAGLVPTADVGMLYSVPSKWALAFQPPWLPDGAAYQFFGRVERAYDRLVGTWARAVFDAGLQTRILHDRQLGTTALPEGDPTVAAARLPVLFVPGFYVASDTALDWLRAYLDAGGHLVFGPRSTVADALARARAEVLPARFTDLAGVSYQESSNLDHPLPLRPVSTGPLDIAWPDKPTGSRWVDFLTTDDAAVLATYDHPHYGQYAAVTTRPVGSGRVTIVGTEPTAQTAAAIADWAVRIQDPSRTLSVHDRRWGGSDAVRVSTAINAAGARVHVVHHWAWGRDTVTTPTLLRNALTGQVHSAGAQITLENWDVHVFVEISGKA